MGWRDDEQLRSYLSQVRRAILHLVRRWVGSSRDTTRSTKRDECTNGRTSFVHNVPRIVVCIVHPAPQIIGAGPFLLLSSCPNERQIAPTIPPGNRPSYDRGWRLSDSRNYRSGLVPSWTRPKSIRYPYAATSRRVKNVNDQPLKIKTLLYFRASIYVTRAHFHVSQTPKCDNRRGFVSFTTNLNFIYICNKREKRYG